MLATRPIRSIVLTLLVLFGGTAGVDAAVDVEPTTHVGTAAYEAARRSEVTEEQLFVEKINQLRLGLGLEPLRVHPGLVPLARDWAAHLRDQGALSHAEDLSVGVTEEWSRLGENVGVGPGGGVQALFDAFVASPAHYANLVKPDYRYIGVGVVHGDDGRIWTTHRFMALASGTSGVPTTAGAATADTTDAAPPTSGPPSSNTPTSNPPTSNTPARQTTPTTTAAPPTSTGARPTDEAAPDATVAPSIRGSVAPALVRHIADELAAAGL